MRFLYLVPLFFAPTLSYKLIDSQYEQEVRFNSFKQALTEQFGELIADKLASIKPEHALVIASTANINAFVDALLPRVNKEILKAGFDPYSLPDDSVKTSIGKCTLTEGVLTLLSTIERYEDVTVTYDSATKKAIVEIILRWQDLKMVYKYHTKVVLLKINGHVTANIEHMKIHLKLGFDFNTYQISVDSLDFKHTGDIDLKFSGNKFVDKITNAMSKVLTTIFHNLILNIVKKVAMDPVQTIVDDINNAINHFLRP